MSQLSFCEKLNLILWKNRQVLYYHWKQLLFCLCSPVFFAILLVMLRVMIVPEKVAVLKFDPLDLGSEWRKLITLLEVRARKLQPLHFNVFMPRIAVAYAPDTIDYVNRIMEKAATDYLYNVELVRFATTEELQVAMMNNHYLVGVKFQTSHADGTQLTFSLVYPSELRMWDTPDKISESWHTFELFQIVNTNKRRFANQHDGGFVGYVREGFASVQNAISMTYISLIKPDKILPRIILQRFPYMAKSEDTMANDEKEDVPFVICIGYLYPVIFLSLYLYREKETQIFDFFQVMGISYLVQTIAWLIDGFIILLICSLIFIAALQIHWCEGFAIFTYSSWMAVLFLFIAYNLATMSFTFMIVSFFNSSATAVLALVILFISSIFPAALAYPSGSLTMQLLACIFSNSCMFIALEEIMKFESMGIGYQWRNFFDDLEIGDKLPIGVIIIILITLSVIYALIGLCAYYWSDSFMELNKIGWSFIIRKLGRSKKASIKEDEPTSRQKRLSSAFELNTEYKRIIVDIKNLTKTYQNSTVVKDFTISLFENEIVVLMGHNGSGKTTLLSMITGMIKPTRGEVIINGNNISKDPDKAFEDIGFCPQNDLLIPELNVFNQLIFHCRLKGLTYEFLEFEVEKYLTAMNIYDSREQITGELSVGLKRFLSVCCALCGGSKLVIMDEPDAGMDMIIRRNVRDILLSEKYGRTILMTTQSITEADCVADRIMMISGGVLKCFGTSFFLRNRYCNGFNLICKKDEQCDSNAVTHALQKFFPIRLMPESDIGTELSYRLDERYSMVFTAILDYMEQNRANLNILSISFGEASIEDVFLSVGVENPGEGRDRMSASLNGTMLHIDEISHNRFLSKTKKFKGFQLLKSRWLALLYKRFLFDFRVRSVIILQILAPLVFTALSFPLETKTVFNPILPIMTYRLTQYPESVTILDLRKGNAYPLLPSIIKNYQDIITSMGAAHQIYNLDEYIFNEFIIDLYHRNENDVNFKYLIAGSFNNFELIAWFNNYPLHTVPLTLNIMHNALLRAITNDSNAVITVSHEALPNSSPKFLRWYFDGRILAMDLTFCLSIVWSISIMNLVREWRNNFKLLQYIHGARPFSYWFSVFFYDFIWNISIAIIVVLVMLAYARPIILQVEIIAAYFLTLTILGALILPFNYVLLYLFENELTAFGISIFISTFGCAAYISSLNQSNYKIVELFRIIPHYSLALSLFKIFNYGTMMLYCKDEIYNKISTTLEGCTEEPNCCTLRTLWTWSKYDFLSDMLSILIISICSLVILIIIELRGVNKAGILNPNYPEDNRKAAKEDYKLWHSKKNPLEGDSVQQEQIRAYNVKPEEYFDKPLVMKAVGNIQKRTVKIRRVFLVVNRSECLGVFGTAVAGKSAFMKTLVDNRASSYGQIYVYGLSLRSQLYEVYNRIGYCQQNSANLENFYAPEVLKILCMLHGIPRKNITPISESLARVFGYWSHYKKQIKYYSPGLRRRFRTSLSIIGNPSIIYMDEPMLGLDLGALRKLCNVICRLRRTGSSIIYASLRYTCSEIFCSRFSFLNRGSFTQIGTVNELEKNFFKGYILKLKVKANSEITALQLGSTDALFMPNPFLKVQTFVETTFHNAIMKYQRGNLMYFLIPKQNLKISFIFEELKRHEFHLNIETFMVSTNTLPLFYSENIERSTVENYE